jgi:hypothetical protein
MNGWIGWVGDCSNSAGSNPDITQLQNADFGSLLEEGKVLFIMIHSLIVFIGDMVIVDGGYQGVRFPAKLPYCRPRRKRGQPAQKLTERQV